MPITKQNVTFTFQDPRGNPLANGRVDIRLQQDISTALSGGPQVSAGRLVSATLDGSGSATVALWPTTQMSPTAVYIVTAYTQQGEPSWRGQLTV